MQGKVKFFDKKKGWGFITRESDGLDYFVHYSQIQMDGFKSLDNDDIVSFEASELEENNRIQAVNVQPILTMKMVEDSLKEEKLYVKTMKDAHKVIKYLVVDANNTIQTSEQGIDFLNLAAFAGFDTEGLLERGEICMIGV